MGEHAKGVSDDDHAGTFDDTRNGLQQGPEQDGGGIARKDEPRGEIEPSGGGDERTPQLEAKVKGFIESLADEEKAALASEQDDELVATMVSTWQGMLPDPSSFAQYPEYAQRQMVAWNDTKLADESKRLDRIADAAISQANRGQWLSFALNAVFAVASFVAFILTGDAAAFGFLAIPGISVVFNIVKDNKSEKDGREG